MRQGLECCTLGQFYKHANEASSRMLHPRTVLQTDVSQISSVECCELLQFCRMLCAIAILQTTANLGRSTDFLIGVHTDKECTYACLQITRQTVGMQVILSPAPIVISTLAPRLSCVHTVRVICTRRRSALMRDENGYTDHHLEVSQPTNIPNVHGNYNNK